MAAGKPLPLCPLRHGESSLNDLCRRGTPRGNFTPPSVLSTPRELPDPSFWSRVLNVGGIMVVLSLEGRLVAPWPPTHNGSNLKSFKAARISLAVLSSFFPSRGTHCRRTGEPKCNGGATDGSSYPFHQDVYPKGPKGGPSRPYGGPRTSTGMQVRTTINKGLGLQHASPRVGEPPYQGKKPFIVRQLSRGLAGNPDSRVTVLPPLGSVSTQAREDLPRPGLTLPGGMLAATEKPRWLGNRPP